MKSFIVLVLFFGAFSAQAAPLKSKALKALVCEQVVDSLLFENIDILLSGVESDCAKSKKFEVLEDKTVFNKTFKKVISLDVAVNYTSNTGVIFTGTVLLRRAPKFDEKTGELALGKWTAGGELDYSITKKAVKPLLDMLVEATGAEAGVGTFNVKKFSAKKVEKEIAGIVEDFDEEQRGYAEEELEEGEELDEDYCKMSSYEGHDNIEQHSDSKSTAADLMKYLEPFVLASYSYDNEGGQSEYCSQFTTRIYFTDGSVFEVFYDFNT